MSGQHCLSLNSGLYLFCFLYNPMSVHMDSSLSHCKPIANSGKLNKVGTRMALKKRGYI